MSDPAYVEVVKVAQSVTLYEVSVETSSTPNPEAVLLDAMTNTLATQATRKLLIGLQSYYKEGLLIGNMFLVDR